MTLFDAYLAVDWSASAKKAPAKASPNAIWVGERVIAEDHTPVFEPESYFQTRQACLDHLRDRLREHRDAWRRVFLGFDFAYGYPAGLAAALGLAGSDSPWRLVWDELTRRIVDHPSGANDRFTVAGEINARCGGAPLGPFWGHPAGEHISGLRPTKAPFPFRLESGRVLEEKRATERMLPRTHPTWKLWGAGAVGGQTVLGIPAVATLRDDSEFADISRVWPFETGFGLSSVSPGTPLILHVEIWPGVVNDRLDPTLAIRDQAQVRAMVGWLAELDAANELLPLFARPERLSAESLKRVKDEEGWIFGSGR